MKIEILDQAQEDLIQGFRFSESQEPGLGVYFLDCLFSDMARKQRRKRLQVMKLSA